jgi:hypothetical protein
MLSHVMFSLEEPDGSDGAGSRRTRETRRFRALFPKAGGWVNGAFKRNGGAEIPLPHIDLGFDIAF